MELPYSSELPIHSFSRLFDNMSESYKLFWFQAVIEHVIQGKNRITFSEIIDYMIADAWYMVSEYRLNFEPSDTLEKLVFQIYENSGLKTTEKKENILKYLQDNQEPEVIQMKRTLALHVPFRLQAPFLTGAKASFWKSQATVIERMNQEKHLLYYYDQVQGLKRSIRINEEWLDYILANQSVLLGWLQFHMIEYLQKRNPSVPGIPNKISPPAKRHLEKVKKYWKAIVTVEPVCDIYTGKTLTGEEVSIDHFIPWSYVAHDELYNLTPTTKNVNSSKSNRLPDWNTYFGRLCRIEYQAYQIMWRNRTVHALFEHCKKEHINSQDALIKLYDPSIGQETFYKNLEDILHPVYNSALNMGFPKWEASGS